MVTIAEQVYIFLYAILGGAIVAFLYDILRIKRRAIKTSIIIINLEDILFWLISAVLMFILVYNTNDGEIRGYIFAGNVIGVMLYLALLSNIIITSSVMVINLIKKIIKFLFKIVSYPFILIFKVLKVPCSFLFRVIFKIFKLFGSKFKRIGKKGYALTRGKAKKIAGKGKRILKIRKKVK